MTTKNKVGETNWRPDDAMQAFPWDKAVIHPAMSVNLGGNLVRACKTLDISIWDRELVYRAIGNIALTSK